MLADPTSAKAWLVDSRLASPGTEYDADDLRRLTRCAARCMTSSPPTAATGLQRRAVTSLNEAARRVRLGVRLHPVDGYRLVAEGVGVDRPIGELLMSVTGAMAAGNWNRLKVCSNEALPARLLRLLAQPLRTLVLDGDVRQSHEGSRLPPAPWQQSRRQ